MCRFCATRAESDVASLEPIPWAVVVMSFKNVAPLPEELVASPASSLLRRDACCPIRSSRALASICICCRVAARSLSVSRFLDLPICWFCFLMLCSSSLFFRSNAWSGPMSRLPTTGAGAPFKPYPSSFLGLLSFFGLGLRSFLLVFLLVELSL